MAFQALSIDSQQRMDFKYVALAIVSWLMFYINPTIIALFLFTFRAFIYLRYTQHNNKKPIDDNKHHRDNWIKI